MRRPQFTKHLQTTTRSLHRAIPMIVVVAMLSGLGDTWNPALVADDEVNKLRNDQEAVAGRYSRFERLLSQMADMLGREDPERAELLRRAISEGREQAISSELESITDSLNEGNFGSAREKQRRVTKSMQQILILLQSEDRRSEVEKERERLNELLKDIRNLTARQKAARAATQNSRSPSNAAPDQQQTLKKTDEILDGVESHDQSNEDSESKDSNSRSEQSDPKDNQSEGQQADGKQGDRKNKKDTETGQPKDGSDSKQSDSQQADGKQADGKQTPPGDQPKDSAKTEDDPKSPESDSKDGQPKQSDQPKPKDGKQTQPSDSDPSDSPQNQQPSGKQQSGQQSSGQQNQKQQQKKQQQTPGREQLEEAKKAMQEAIDQLKKQQRDGALKQQDDAISKLQEAQKKLEETLKQLREEEKEMILAALEARFQRMLSLQTQIYEDTVALGSTVRAEWLNTAITRCRELSQQQADLTRECSLTVGLLREDGTSVSILIAVEDIESDMKTVASRLQQTKAAELTQSMQTDVIEALKELIETAQKEMEEMKQDQKPQQQQSGPQQKAALVELMAEIKVLRSLQLRVNRRTATVDRLLQENDATEQAGLLNQVEELAIRQNRLTESAGELARQMEKK